MSGKFSTVKRGDQLEISADDWNGAMAAARAYAKGQYGVGGGPPGAAQPNPVIVRVKNASGSDLNQCAVLGVDSPIFPPPGETLSAENVRHIDFVGVKPTSEHRSAFVVTLEPLKANAIGRAVVSGVCWVKVSAGDDDDDDPQPTRAEVSDGSTSSLIAATDGSAQVLYRQSGAGEKWALVRLADGLGSGGATQFKVIAAGLTSVGAHTWDGTTLGSTTHTITTGRYHDVNDVIYAVPVANVPEAWIECMRLPVNTTQYKVLQTIDTAGRVGFDYVRAH